MQIITLTRLLGKLKQFSYRLSWVTGIFVVMSHLLPLIILSSLSWKVAYTTMCKSEQPTVCSWRAKMHLVAGGNIERGAHLTGDEVRFEVNMTSNLSKDQLIHSPAEIAGKYALACLDRNSLITAKAVGSFESLLKSLLADSILIPVARDLTTNISSGLKVRLTFPHTTDKELTDKQKQVKEDCTKLFNKPRLLKAIIDPPSAKAISLLALDGAEDISECFSTLDYKALIPLHVIEKPLQVPGGKL